MREENFPGLNLRAYSYLMASGDILFSTVFTPSRREKQIKYCTHGWNYFLGQDSAVSYKTYHLIKTKKYS